MKAYARAWGYHDDQCLGSISLGDFATLASKAIPYKHLELREGSKPVVWHTGLAWETSVAEFVGTYIGTEKIEVEHIGRQPDIVGVSVK